MILAEKGGAAQPLPITDVARHLVVDQPLLKHVGATHPIDIAAAPGQETGHRVPAQMVDPAFLLELAHQRVDEGEPRPAVLPPLKPRLGYGAVDRVRPRRQPRLSRVGRLQMPRDEAAVGVVVRLGEGIAQLRLRAEIHVSKQKLARQTRRWDGVFLPAGFVSVHDVLHGPVEEPAADAPEMQVGTEQRRRLRGEGGWRRCGLGEFRGVFRVRQNDVELLERNRLPAAMTRRRGLDA